MNHVLNTIEYHIQSIQEEQEDLLSVLRVHQKMGQQDVVDSVSEQIKVNKKILSEFRRARYLIRTDKVLNSSSIN